MKKNKILYIFGPGRVEKIKNSSINPHDFFYGYKYFSDKYITEIIEVNKNETNKHGIRKILYFYDRLVMKLTSYPSYCIELYFKKNLKIIKNSENVVYTSDALFLSLLPIVFLNKLKRRNIKNYVITMGLFGKSSNTFLRKIFNKIYQKIYLYSADKFIFLGLGEYNFALLKHAKYKSKFNYVPFGVDVAFWTNFESQERKGVLFVGNDGKRDFELLEKIIKKLKNIKFTVITSHKIETRTQNLELINGNWSKQNLSDEMLRTIYSNSELTIIPLIDSYQPSGQSVALQSLNCGTPILISKTHGFFSDESFIKDFKINFVNSNNLNEWEEEIYKILKNTDKFKLNSNQKLKLSKFYSVESFFKKLEEIIFN